MFFNIVVTNLTLAILTCIIRNLNSILHWVTYSVYWQPFIIKHTTCKIIASRYHLICWINMKQINIVSLLWHHGYPLWHCQLQIPNSVPIQSFQMLRQTLSFQTVRTSLKPYICMNLCASKPIIYRIIHLWILNPTFYETCSG